MKRKNYHLHNRQRNANLIAQWPPTESNDREQYIIICRFFSCMAFGALAVNLNGQDRHNLWSPSPTGNRSNSDSGNWNVKSERLSLNCSWWSLGETDNNLVITTIGYLLIHYTQYLQLHFRLASFFISLLPLYSMVLLFALSVSGACSSNYFNQ